MYGHDGAGPAPSLYIGTTVPMISDDECVDVTALEGKIKAASGERRLRICTWNFAGMLSECKQKEVGQVVAKHNFDVVAGQESWERDGFTAKMGINGLESLATIRQA